MDLHLLFAYVDPGSTHCAVSFLGGIIGLLLIGWRQVVAFARVAWQSVTGRASAGGAVERATD